MMTHTMLTVQVDSRGWIVECLDCDRRVAMDRAALDEGDLFDARTVLSVGDETAAHAWSTDVSIGIGVRAD